MCGICAGYLRHFALLSALCVVAMMPRRAEALPAWQFVSTPQSPEIQLVRLAPPRVTMPTIGQEDVIVEARDIQYQGNVYVAKREVTLTRGALRLTADQVTADSGTGEVVAEGRVVFTQPGQTVRTDRLTYNTDTKRVRAAAAETVVNGVIVRARDIDG